MSDTSYTVTNSSLSQADYDAIHPPEADRGKFKSPNVFNPVLFVSGGFLILFVAMATLSPKLLSSLVNIGFDFAAQGFGAFWQVLLLLNFFIGIYIVCGRAGGVRLGNIPAPDIDTFKWISIILCTLLAGGGVFWAAAEPIAHFMNAPPFYGEEDKYGMAINALSQSFLHWGFLAWAILGCLSSIILMHLHYDKGLPLKPRTLLYPILGDRALGGWIGTSADAFSVIATAAGTIGPIGFLGLQVSYALNALFGIPDTFLTQALVVSFAIGVYTISALSGLNRGIQIISRYNVMLAVGLVTFILFFGPTSFIIDGYVQGVGRMVDNLIPMALYRGDAGWLSWWTVFFWGWFIGYGPMMAIFIARISRGRTIRQMILAISVMAPLITCFWFSIVGGSGLAFEISNPGSVQSGFENFNLPGALLAITQQLPLPMVMSVLFLVLTTTFIVTTGDSMTYTISVVMTGSTEPNAVVRAFCGIMMGAVAITLISMGSGGISALQSFIVITAVPVSFILLPSLWYGPKIANEMARAQGLLKES